MFTKKELVELADTVSQKCDTLEARINLESDSELAELLNKDLLTLSSAYAKIVHAIFRGDYSA